MMETKRKNIKEGLHLIMDAYCSPDVTKLISSEENLKKLIIKITHVLNMQILLGPITCNVPLDEVKIDNVEDSGGISAFCVITTSHISMHLWPLENRISLDIYSCKNFDSKLIEALLIDILGVVEHKTHIIDRIF